MELKRHFVKNEDGEWLDSDGEVVPADESGRPTRPDDLVIDYIEVRSTGASSTQRFSTRMVHRELANGLMSLSQGELILHSRPELVYELTRTPGHYCCFCDASLGGEAEAKAHIAEEHGDKNSPDPENPSGYFVANYYEGELLSDPIEPGG